ncbi:lysozyme C-2-like [Ahaetulla prasina]|uniref:lysozyme C-2-like n=1 Tax=Ahaetulla prasina TaxID=499056 RepID=UPI0026499B1F|nr:lysozyme C-2-like [Ahaetulla prasina]
MKALVLTLLFLLIAASEAKRYSKCELASFLKGSGVDGYYGYSLGNWICMASYESSFDTGAVSRLNDNGSRDYGIFQINSRYWCNDNQGHTANGCNKPCSVAALEKSDIVLQEATAMKALVLTFLFLLVAASEAKRYTRCDLASVLKQNGMDGYEGVSLGDWICMASSESSFDTGAVSRLNDNGSRDYGLFQINSRYWCNDNQGRTANGCNKPCSDFIDDDITDDITCVKRVVRDPNGMNAWYGWKSKCQGRDLSEWTRDCKL